MAAKPFGLLVGVFPPSADIATRWAFGKDAKPCFFFFLPVGISGDYRIEDQEYG
jgi:hypothetical protein